VKIMHVSWFRGAIVSALLGSVDAACARPLPTETIAIQVHEGIVLGFDLSPDGRSIVFDLLDPSWSPDGRHVVFRGERHGRPGLWLLKPGAAAPRQLTQLRDPDGFDGQATWSPDGKAIALVRLVPPDSASQVWRSRLAWIDPAGGEPHTLPVADTVAPDLRDPAWSPDGRRFAMPRRRRRRGGGARDPDHGTPDGPEPYACVSRS
jgi:dipeptidyl aminopeptidase/acylaminoacyl peptidase